MPLYPDLSLNASSYKYLNAVVPGCFLLSSAVRVPVAEVLVYQFALFFFKNSINSPLF